MLLADRLKVLRERIGLTQRNVADALCIDIPMYSRMERGERPIRKEQLKTLANVLRTNETDLLTLWLADQVKDVLKDDNDLVTKVLDIAKSDVGEMVKKKKIKVFEAFAGYGGASFGLNKAGIDYSVVGYSEIDKDAIELYEYNFPGIKNWGDITQIKENKLPKFDLFTGGFPCQPFSTVGKRQGELDTRGTLFGDIIRICEYKQPKYILLENVKGLAVGKHKPTFEKILSELRRIGYDVRYAILNSKNYGVPQNRERLWIFAYKGVLPSSFELEPPKVELLYHLSDFLDENPEEELYRTQKQIDRIKELHGIDKFDVPEPLCYDYYNRKIRTDAICMTVTPPEHNVIRIIEPIRNGKERLRKLSLEEHFRLMGFTMTRDYKEIKFPPTQDYTRLGRRAGNGWDVNLVGILMKHIFSQV